MPQVKLTGVFRERETRLVTITDDELAELRADPSLATECLYDAHGDGIAFETESLDDVKWELTE